MACYSVESSWNVMEHGDAREGKWRGSWRMEWIASTFHTTSEHGVSSITTADAHTSATSSRLNWRSPADLNGLVRFAERRNLVSVRVPSHFNWPLTSWAFSGYKIQNIRRYSGIQKLWKTTVSDISLSCSIKDTKEILKLVPTCFGQKTTTYTSSKKIWQCSSFFLLLRH